MKASIIIPTFNHSEPLARCLRPLLQEIQEYEVETEIIVVDDGNAEPVAQRVADCVSAFVADEITLVTLAENRGPSVARNTGVERARGDVLIFIDDDLLPSTRFVRDHLALHLAHPEILLACGHLYTRDLSVYGRYWAHCYNHVFCQPGDGRDLYPIHMLSGGNLSVKREALDRLYPLFDPELRSREDLDLYLRATDAKITVYKTTQALAQVVPRNTLAAFCRQKEWYDEGEAQLIVKYGAAKVQAIKALNHIPFTLDTILLSLLVRSRRKFAPLFASREHKSS